MGGSGGASGELWEALAELQEALGELRNVIFWYKKALWACYCSEIVFSRYKKASAGMLLLRNAIFRYKEAPGHAAAQECHFFGTKKPLRACY